MVADKIYFLDSNALRYYANGDPHFVEGIDRLLDDPEVDVAIPETVLNETIAGLENPNCQFSDDQKQEILKASQHFMIIKDSDVTNEIATEICQDLKRRGQPIGKAAEDGIPNDVRIAAATIEWGGTLVTHNIKHLGKVRALEIETFIPVQKEKLEGIVKAHDRAESQIADLQELLEKGEISPEEFQQEERNTLREMDAGIQEALDLEKRQQAELKQAQDDLKKKEEQMRVAEMLRKKAAALEAVRARSQQQGLSL